MPEASLSDFALERTTFELEPETASLLEGISVPWRWPLAVNNLLPS
jgi:hypothetical protein